MTQCVAGSLLLVSAPVAAAASAACPIPEAVAPAGQDELAAKFGASTAAFRQTAANIREGFARSCAKKLRLSSTFRLVRGADQRRIHLNNWPDANEFVIEAEQRRNGTWRLVLSGPFAASDGSVHVPKSAAVLEAITCAVGAVSKKEQAESGRCLID
jgi:hypothetical protein